METRKQLLPLFEKFISDSKKGIRIQKNGKRISPSSVENYVAAKKYLEKLELVSGSTISINTKFRLNKREYLKEKNYWSRLYRRLRSLMNKSRCSDNYIGMLMKVYKTFLRYLEDSQNFPKLDLHRHFYSPKADTAIHVIDQEKLQFLILNGSFHDKLPVQLRNTKDMLVFGCTVGLRFSDLVRLGPQNLEVISGNTYIVTVSKKTGISTRIKLPAYAEEIVMRHKRGRKLLPEISLNIFNKHLKQIGELAGWTYRVGKKRSYNGVIREIKTHAGKDFRYCDLMSSHIMRKTAITTMLNFGMAEALVRKVSGHAPNSKEFYRYVKFSESFFDGETDKVFKKLLGS